MRDKSSFSFLTRGWLKFNAILVSELIFFYGQKKKVSKKKNNKEMVVIFFYEVITFFFFMLHAERTVGSFFFIFFSQSYRQHRRQIERNKERKKNQVYEITSVWVDFKNIIIFITSSQFLHVFLCHLIMQTHVFQIQPALFIFCFFFVLVQIIWRLFLIYTFFYGLFFLCSNVLICRKYVRFFEFMRWKLF